MGQVPETLGLSVSSVSGPSGSQVAVCVTQRSLVMVMGSMGSTIMVIMVTIHTSDDRNGKYNLGVGKALFFFL